MPVGPAEPSGSSERRRRKGQGEGTASRKASRRGTSVWLPPERPAMVLVVVMGVSGSGKSTVGSLLADKLGWKFYDADDYHPEQNRRKMAEGIPLNDQDRIPWLCHLHAILMREHASGQNAILACSALKKMYRCILENGETNCQSLNNQQEEKKSATQKILFVHLAGSMDLIASRLGKRKGHFMPPTLLQSQFDTLEPPLAPENFITVGLEKPILEIVSDIERHIRNLY